MNRKETKRKQFVVMIGPLLKECLDKQIESINKICFNSLKTSDYYAGEILAKKILNSNLV